ncbi:hypothetical protein DFR43_10935 [Tepidicella xavieri]|uniref:Uncharacterized protein n=1 Tax=Tepidicella xavieri TaxID=360241 RepID=A0A4R6U9G2_9BURK|nr:hypothetical protein DFR43_10935 [Tepidicella xavieri]
MPCHPRAWEAAGGSTASVHRGASKASVSISHAPWRSYQVRRVGRQRSPSCCAMGDAGAGEVQAKRRSPRTPSPSANNRSPNGRLPNAPNSCHGLPGCQSGITVRAWTKGTPRLCKHTSRTQQGAIPRSDKPSHSSAWGSSTPSSSTRTVTSAKQRRKRCVTEPGSCSHVQAALAQGCAANAASVNQGVCGSTEQSPQRLAPRKKPSALAEGF